MAHCVLVKKADITPELVSRLVAAQFPQWAGLPVRPVEADGWDNATFRLGDRMSVRLPSSPAYAEQVAKEQRWLPVLRPQLPLPVPEPLAAGRPGCGFPRPWSVYRWIDGQTAASGPVASLPEFAADLAGFLAALYAVDPSGGPEPGPHNFFRGGSPGYYDAETRAALAALHGHIDTGRAAEVWETALAARWDGPPVWFHGDAQPGNLLLRLRRPAERRHRLRHLRDRRSGLRHHDRVDVPVRAEPARVPRSGCRPMRRPGRAAAAGPSGRR